MAEKQPQLNGAYYGPSIPPPQNYHRPGRGSGCGCCLLSFFFRVIITAVVLAGLAVLIVWLILRPNKVKFHVTDATLTEFNLTTNNYLQYNLALNMTVRNPNKRIGIYYDRIEARAIYEDQRFGSAFLTPFYQGHKNTTTLSPILFQGQQLLVLGTDETTQFNKDKVSGIYSIDVKLYLKIRFKVGKIKTGKFKPKIECDLKLPLDSTSGTLASGTVTSTKCDIDF